MRECNNFPFIGLVVRRYGEHRIILAIILFYTVFGYVFHWNNVVTRYANAKGKIFSCLYIVCLLLVSLHLCLTKICKQKSTNQRKRHPAGNFGLGAFPFKRGLKILYTFLLLIAACAAARRAIGTRKGEQET